jgi:hypothetical protein
MIKGIEGFILKVLKPSKDGRSSQITKIVKRELHPVISTNQRRTKPSILLISP